MRALLSPCAVPGCPALVSRGRCPRHARPTRWGQGNRGNHRTTAVRDLVLREEPVCRYCASAPSCEVDHIVALARGGTSERHNLAGVCRRCHALKSRAEASAGAARARR